MALFSNALSVIRQYLSSQVGDLILSTAVAPLGDYHYTDSSLRKADNYYQDHGYSGYCYEGTAIGQEREVYDWVYANRTILFAPPFSPSLVASDKFELHYIFTEAEYRRAINLSIEAMAGKYLIDIKDETTIRLTSTKDNLGNIVYTWEYALPLSMLYLYRVITEEAVNGVKLTGTVSGTLTAGETVTGSTSGATGEFVYQGASDDYIRLRKVSGTFVVGEDADGASESCDTLTAVESETAGGSRWLDKDIIDPRFYSIIKSYSPKLKLNKGYYSVNEDLYLRLEGQGAQPLVDDDTDVIYLPPKWLVAEAILNLPRSKIESRQLDNIYRQAEKDAMYYRFTARNHPNPRARKVVE